MVGDVLDAITKLMAADRLIFVPVALNWLGGLLLLILAWMVVKVLLQRLLSSGGGGFDMYPLAALIIQYLVLFTILKNWAFVTSLVTDEVRFLRNLVEHGQESEIFTTVTGITTQVSSAMPLLPSPRDIFVIGIITIVLAALEAAVYFVLTFGFIASAICQIVGPLFVSLSIIPGAGWMMAGWIRSFIGYSLYPLFGALYCDVAAQILLFFVKSHPPPWSSVDLGVMIATFVMICVGLCVGVWKIPRLPADILGGYTGTSAVPSLSFLRRF